MATDQDPIVVRMREARQRNGWSLTDAEEHAGIHRLTIGAYERGERVPPLSKLRRWVEAYGMHLLVADVDPFAESRRIAAERDRLQRRIDSARGWLAAEVGSLPTGPERNHLARVADGVYRALFSEEVSR